MKNEETEKFVPEKRTGQNFKKRTKREISNLLDKRLKVMIIKMLIK